MRRRRLWTSVLGILASVAGTLVYAMWPGSSTFTVGKETTYVTGPLDKHGYVDYVTALNEQLSKGITPDNNANVLIWKALGLRPEGGPSMTPEYFQWLGIESPPEQGEYLVSWQNYLKEHSKIGDDKERVADSDQMLRAASWPWTANDESEIADWRNHACGCATGTFARQFGLMPINNQESDDSDKLNHTFTYPLGTSFRYAHHLAIKISIYAGWIPRS